MILDVTRLSDPELKAALDGLSLTMTLGEARRVAELLGRAPTETELTLFDTMWSEHCSYKSSRAVLKQHLPTQASNVILGPGEDAGIVHFTTHEGVRWAIAVAHESHNHPSQVMPVEGAATGIGGVVRDVYCMGADVVATLDPLRFGDPQGPHGERSKEIAREVMAGIALYGNALGVPNLGGDVVFDRCYDDNCLVNVVAVGIVREDSILRSRVPEAARNEPYDFILIGKPTDWSGMGGAAFASADLDHAAAVENKGAVQVPDPFLKRVIVLANQALFDLVRDEGVEIGFKDLGAGGIACASSELAASAGMGIDVDIAEAALAEDDLPDRVAACSETQERFALAVPARMTQRVLALYNEEWDLSSIYRGAGARCIGRVVVPAAGEAPRYTLRRGAELLVDAPIDVITEGVRYDRPAKAAVSPSSASPWTSAGRDLHADFQALMASPHLCSRSSLYHHYDSEVKAGTVLRPGEADAGVVAPIPGSAAGIALTADGNPRQCAVDAHLGGAHAVVEAVRNVACVGAVPVAVTDCLNFGSPEDPAVFHDFIESVRGIGDACRGLGRVDAADEPLPVISGNVSFYNQSARGGAVHPSPIVSCLGVVEDVSCCRSLSFKQAGHVLVRVGQPRLEMGGSLYAHFVGGEGAGSLPPLDYEALRAEIPTVIEGVRCGEIVAAHDVSEGGTLAALAEMALGPDSRGGRGVHFTTNGFGDGFAQADAGAALFGEAGGFLLEMSASAADGFVAQVRQRGGWAARCGEVVAEPVLRVEHGDTQLEWEMAPLAEAREAGMAELLSREATA